MLKSSWHIPGCIERACDIPNFHKNIPVCLRSAGFLVSWCKGKPSLGARPPSDPVAKFAIEVNRRWSSRREARRNPEPGTFSGQVGENSFASPGTVFMQRHMYISSVQACLASNNPPVIVSAAPSGIVEFLVPRQLSVQVVVMRALLPRWPETGVQFDAPLGLLQESEYAVLLHKHLLLLIERKLPSACRTVWSPPYGIRPVKRGNAVTEQTDS